MKLDDKLISIKIVEIFIIIFPITLLFSNIVAEILILLLIIFYLLKVKLKVFYSDLKKPIILFLIIFWLYLILNTVINIDNKPSLERAIFFIRFPLLILSLNYVINTLNIDLKRIFNFWFFIFIVVSIDLYIQYFTHSNILGYQAIQQGSVYRLGGFMNDELKISNLIYHFGALIFSYYFCKKSFLNINSTLLSLIFLIFITISIFLTAERANFITVCLFISLLIIFLAFKNKKIFLIYFSVFTILLSLGIITKDSHSKRMINDLVNKVQLFEINSDENFLKKNSHYFAHYSAAYQLFERNIFFGVGLKNFRKFCDDKSLDEKIHKNWHSRKCATHPHNFYFEMLSEIGFIGFILILSFFIFSFYKFFNLYSKKDNSFLLLKTFILFVYFIPFLPKGSFFSNWNAMIFWFVFSFIYSSYLKLLKKKN